MFTEEEKKYIVGLAHRAIEHYFEYGKLPEIDESELVSKKLTDRRACFVTLTMGKHLRGCIGHIDATQALYLDIIENAVSAAFEDSRFTPLTKAEFVNTEIEVSILTEPSPLNFISPDDLLSRLRPGIDGIILRKGHYGATYLPQVWQEIADKKEFLSSLCMKAGLTQNEWREPGLRIAVYQVEAIKQT